MRLLLLIFCLTFLRLNGIAQSNLFEFDFAQFGYDSVSNYVEFYYSFNQSQMMVNNTDTSDNVEGVLSINIQDTETEEILVNNEWKIIHGVEETRQGESKSLVGVLGFALPEGNYEVNVGGRDQFNEENRRDITDYINVKPFWKSDHSVSSIELASRIIQNSENKNSIFYKNTYEIIPMPTSVFGENLPVVFYYSELYNLQEEDAPDLELKQILYDSRGNVINTKTKSITRNINSRVEVGSIVVNEFPTDTYTLVLALMDSAENVTVSSSKRFFIYNPDVVNTDTTSGSGSNILASEFGVMSEEELDILFDQAKYIATNVEKDQYEKLSTENAKKEFLHKFWSLRDDPSSPGNEYYKEYRNRVEASNQKFTSMGTPGWKSDRGRVFILYGEPSEIERHPNETDSKPYEIWYYHEIEGGVMFIFGDITGFSNYIMLHSTMRGEYFDDNWQRRLTSF